MIRIRSRIAAAHSKNGDFVIQRKLLGRLFNGAMVLVLSIAVLLALLNGESISNAGIVIFGIIFLATLFNAGENKVYRFSGSEGRLTITHSFLGLRLKRVDIPLSALMRVMVTGVEFNSFSPRRKNPGIYKLQVRIDLERLEDNTGRLAGKLTLEDSTDALELHNSGSALASYLDIDFESEYQSPGV